jgi:dTDP-4-dehydrorhamnose reductase
MLGHKLVQVLGVEHEVWAGIRRPFSEVEKYGVFAKDKTITISDVSNKAALTNVLNDLRPNVIINAAGVIKQVPDAADMATLIEINSLLPHRLAEIGTQIGARVITIGTDCVFSGQKGNYSETDVPDATDFYGRSKLLGELNAEHCLTLRTSIIGRELDTKHSLVEWFLANRGTTVTGFSRAIYSGMPTVVFATVIKDLLESPLDISGIYHVASSHISKYDLLQLINSYFKAGVEIEPTDEPTIDRSLIGSRFENATGIEIPDWHSMIAFMAADPTPYDDLDRKP